jgi:hypothetical protein
MEELTPPKRYAGAEIDLGSRWHQTADAALGFPRRSGIRAG